MKITTSTGLTKMQKLSFQLMCQKAIVILVCLLLTSTLGCHKLQRYLPKWNAESPKPVAQEGLFKTSYIARQFDQYYRGINPGPIGVATLVNIDDLYSTSTFGRIYAEQIMSEMAMRGFDVVELRHSDALQFLASSGEFALSRDIALVRRARDLGGIVVGTYAVSPLRVYVNARLLDPSTSVVLSVGSVEVPKSGEVARLLRGGTLPSTLERIPVRHLGVHTYPALGSWLPPTYGMHWGADEEDYSAPQPQFALPKMKKQPEPLLGHAKK